VVRRIDKSWMAEMAEKGRVLVVDDDEDVLNSCRDALEDIGFAVACATTGSEGRRLLELETFDAAVFDLVLPDVEGTELLQLYRERDPDGVAIIITGYASLESALAALQMGAYDYLQKPFRPEDFLHTVERGCERRRLAQANTELIQKLEAANRELSEHKGRLEEQVRAATRELEELVRLGQTLGMVQDTQAATAEVLEAARSLTGAAAAAVFRADTDEPTLRGRACVGMITAEVLATEIRLGAGAIGRAAEQCAVVVENEALSPDGPEDDFLRELSLRSVVAAPMAARGQLLGVLAAFEKDGGFRDTDAHLVSALASVLAPLSAAGDQTPADDQEFVPLRELAQRPRPR
jgi:DNA-binding response OmpR family regulator